MKLILTIEGRVMASTPLFSPRMKEEYYLKAFRRLLTLRHQQKLATLQKAPAFEVVYQEDNFSGL